MLRIIVLMLLLFITGCTSTEWEEIPLEDTVITFNTDVIEKIEVTPRWWDL